MLAFDSTAPSEVDAQVDRVFANWNSPSTPGCAVGVAVKGQPVLAKAYGFADLEHDVRNTPETIFEAGSVPMGERQPCNSLTAVPLPHGSSIRLRKAFTGRRERGTSGLSLGDQQRHRVRECSHAMVNERLTRHDRDQAC